MFRLFYTSLLAATTNKHTNTELKQEKLLQCTNNKQHNAEHGHETKKKRELNIHG
jgi:hypothetical protein